MLVQRPARPDQQSMIEPTTTFTVGTLPDPKLHNLAASYPFTQQVDVVFQSSDALEGALRALGTCYVKANVRLSDMVRDAEREARASESMSGRTMTVLSITPPVFHDDRWCIDDRGVLTLDLCVETYHRLGLVGTKVHSAGKKGEERRVIHSMLVERGKSVDTPERRREMLTAWDVRRAAEDNSGTWDVLYHGPSEAVTQRFAAEKGHTLRRVDCQVRRTPDVFVPSAVTFTQCPSSKPAVGQTHDEGDALDDWNSGISAMLEWVGMACLGAQRLAGNDRVDPYVAVYEPPTPSQLGEITHLRWRGLLPATFVQTVIDTAESMMPRMSSESMGCNPFVAIVCQTCPSTPVSYIPVSAFEPGQKEKLPRSRVDGGTWCVILGRDSEEKCGTWLKADNVGF